MQHIPVLKKEVLSFLRESDCNIADLTAGLGGHSKLFLQQQQRQEQGKKIKLFLVDRDEEALKGCRKDLLSISKKKDNGFFFETDFFHNDFYSQTNCWKKSLECPPSPAVRSAMQSDSRKKERTSFFKTGICCI